MCLLAVPLLLVEADVAVINGRTYLGLSTLAAQPTMRLGEVQEWTIVEPGETAHPLHMHVHHFQLVAASAPNTASHGAPSAAPASASGGGGGGGAYGYSPTSAGVGAGYGRAPPKSLADEQRAAISELLLRLAAERLPSDQCATFASSDVVAGPAAESGATRSEGAFARKVRLATPHTLHACTRACSGLLY